MNSKLKCLIIDDELPGLSYTKLLCEQIPFVDIVGCYDDPEKFEADSKVLDFDACIMDIHMPGLNGIQLAQTLVNKQVIFVSAHSEYAADAFEVEALDFIRKPANKERLEKALAKALNQSIQTKPKKNSFSWNTQQGKTIIAFEDIVYISTSAIDKRDKVTHLKTGVQLVLKNITFNKLQKLLPAADFCKVNKREMICRSIVKNLSAEQIGLKNTEHSSLPPQISMGEIYRSAFIKWMDI